MRYNARLSGEQRYNDTQLLHRKHKSKSNQNRQALRIRLKAFVMWLRATPLLSFQPDYS
ncbi:hypothetical protein PTB44_004506 [Vibrio parahaemolyticus]|nr:hypothetical protein [Vibrio parahaemolyticus]